MIRTATWSTSMVGSLYPTRVGYFKRIVTVELKFLCERLPLFQKWRLQMECQKCLRYIFLCRRVLCISYFCYQPKHKIKQINNHKLQSSKLFKLTTRTGVWGGVMYDYKLLKYIRNNCTSPSLKWSYWKKNIRKYM